MKVHLKTLGCRLNEAELETWAHEFEQQGHAITTINQQADVVVINSCAVTHDAARKSRHLIRRIHRENPSAKLVVSGCYATLNPNEAADIMGVDLVVSNQDKRQLVAKTLAGIDMTAMPAMSTEPGASALFTRGRQRAFVKVQDGCRYSCTFCIVTIARGEEQSRALAEIVAEVNTLVEQGVSEIVLTGVHLGGYGSDIASNLTELVQVLLAETDIARIRLGSLEPWEFSDEFFTLFEQARVMPHLHLPLQSGADSVLKRMARRCKTAEFADIVTKLKQAYADFNITTDIIVGFPGETEQEWQDSLAFIQAMVFGHIHIFSYSKRAGTKAASLPNQVAEPIKKQRSRELHELAKVMKQSVNHAFLGNTYPVLWEAYTEAYHDKQLAFGYTPNYLRVATVIEAGQSLENQLLNARLIDVKGETVFAELAMN